MTMTISPATTIRPREDAIAVEMFLERFMPSGSIQRLSTRPMVFDWYGDFRYRLGRSSPVFVQALSAFCWLFLGQRCNNRTWIQHSQVLYSSASAKISAQCCQGHRGSSVDEDLISASMAMASYEVRNPSWLPCPVVSPYFNSLDKVVYSPCLLPFSSAIRSLARNRWLANPRTMGQ
jgi:hypothetical protein